MTPEQIRADRELSEAGPRYQLIPSTVFMDGESIAFTPSGEAWNRRVLRLPELEDVYLALTDRVAQLEKALKFYADPAGTGYDVIVTQPECYLETGEIIGDEGRIARAALRGEKL